LYESNHTKANNVQFNTKFAGNGPVTGDFGLAYAKATGDYEAAQADVEHGFYGAFGSANPSIQPTAPGCNNGANNCTNGNHGYAFIWNNGGTTGLPSAGYPNNYGYTNVTVQSGLYLIQIQLGWANTVDEKQYSFKFDLHAKAGIVDLTGGARYQDRGGRVRPRALPGKRHQPYGIGGSGRRHRGRQLLYRRRVRHVPVLQDPGTPPFRIPRRRPTESAVEPTTISPTAPLP